MDNEEPHFEAESPGSPLSNSLQRAAATIDDLTADLVKYSRIPSPDQSTLRCCCERDDCENTKAWLECRKDIQSRLLLSAEVGQALLQRHEAYVRRHERQAESTSQEDSIIRHNETDQNEADSQIDNLLKEKATLEKRLNQALVNNEVAEVSNKTVLNELHESKATITRLTTLHARSVGWETRLNAALQSKEDMQQERDSEAHRARLAEARIAGLKERTDKLQAEMRRLQEDLEQRRQHRLESSESILQEARFRLESMHQSPIIGSGESSEFLKAMESLVKDDETLKADNNELRKLLAEAREDLRALQEEVEIKQLESPPPDSHQIPNLKRSLRDSIDALQNNRGAAFGWRERPSLRPLDLLTPETDRRSLSPEDHLITPSDPKWSSQSYHHKNYSASDVSLGNENDAQPLSGVTPHKALYLLSRSRGVQTDPPTDITSRSPLPHHLSVTPRDLQSETSSFSDSQPSQVSAIVERAAALLVRMGGVDAVTLINRLRRQHLQGADVRHLSRSTVSNIISEAAGLRTVFRSLLEDERVTTTCTRKDLRTLFKFIKDIFTELGQLRVTLNDITLDPSLAFKLNNDSLSPANVEDGRAKDLHTNAAASWIAPISRLFGTPTPSEVTRGISSINRGDVLTRTQARVIPKIAPVSGASTTTVNVEFSGGAVGRSSTSITSSHPSRNVTINRPLIRTTDSQSSSSSVMGIFAGAPSNTSSPDEPWVVLPRGVRRMALSRPTPTTPSQLKPMPFRRAAIANSAAAHRLSRQVDAVIDLGTTGPEELEEPNVEPPLIQRKLRRRGLSDSSIHSSFTAHEEPNENEPIAENGPSERQEAWPNRATVFSALSRRMENFRQTATGALSAVAASSVQTLQAQPPPSIHSRQQSSGSGSNSQPSTLHAGRATSPKVTRLLPDMSSWAATNELDIEESASPLPFYVGSVRREPKLRGRNKDYDDF